MLTNTKWEAVIGEHGQPSPMYRGLVCLVSCSPSISVVTADGSTVQADEWEDVARLIASAPDLAARAESAEAALAAARQENARLRRESAEAFVEWAHANGRLVDDKATDSPSDSTRKHYADFVEALAEKKEG